MMIVVVVVIVNIVDVVVLKKRELYVCWYLCFDVFHTNVSERLKWTHHHSMMKLFSNQKRMKLKTEQS